VERGDEDAPIKRYPVRSEARYLGNPRVLTPCEIDFSVVKVSLFSIGYTRSQVSGAQRIKMLGY
jgi:hypothetical protein